MHDPIFDSFRSDQLSQICKLMSLDPVVSTAPLRYLSNLSEEAASAWLASNARAVEREVCRLGSWSFGDQKSYHEIVRDLAAKMGASVRPVDSVEQIERSLILKLWNDALEKLTPEQVEELKERARQISTKYGKSLGKELTGFAALTAAQMSGFGVYMLGSTVLGAVNGALGLGLGFGAFTGLSSLISTVTGPIGWAALGMVAIVKLGAPNYKKILPVVIFIAAQRSLIGVVPSGTRTIELPRPPINLPKELPEPKSLRVSHAERYLNKACDYSEGLRGRLEAKRAAKRAARAEEAGLAARHEQTPKKAGVPPGEAAKTPHATSDMLAVFEEEVRLATSVAQTSRRSKAKSLPLKRVASKLEKHVFDLKPENKLLREVARESVGDHFLDLSEVDQDDIRKMAQERIQMEEATAEQYRKDSERAKRDEKQRQQVEEKLGAKATKGGREGKGADKKLRNSRNFLKATFPNLQFSNRALERYKSYEGSVLHSSFASKFRLLDQGNIVDKHHVPATTPKVFQMDCGGHGKLYYRRGSDGHSICIEMLGDKNSQPRDLKTLQSI
jgi:uncharacterized protein YaaW (UPF0174 family)